MPCQVTCQILVVLHASHALCDYYRLLETLVKSVSDLPSWHQPGALQRREPSSSPARPGFQQQGYVSSNTATTKPDAPVASLTVPCCVQAKLMSDCSGSIDSVKRIKLLLNDEEELEDVGLSGGAADKRTSTGDESAPGQPPQVCHHTYQHVFPQR